MPEKTYLLLLHSSLVQIAYFRNRRKTHFPDFRNVICSRVEVEGMRSALGTSTLEKKDYLIM